jgi:hypothetical protein
VERAKERRQRVDRGRRRDVARAVPTHAVRDDKEPIIDKGPDRVFVGPPFLSWMS